MQKTMIAIDVLNKLPEGHKIVRTLKNGNIVVMFRDRFEGRTGPLRFSEFTLDGVYIGELIV